MRCLATLALLLAVAGCAATPPAGWESGGGELFMPRARWVNGATVVDIDDQGRVYVDGRHWVSIDTAGRMYGAEREPVALLREDGMVYGPDDRPLGWVGANQAMLPGGEHSWLFFDPSGLLIRSDDGDTGQPYGQWLGCQHPQTRQTCMYISHVLALQLQRADGRGRRSLGPGIGIGVGVGF